MDLENDPNVFEILMHVMTGNGGDMAEMDSRIVRQISKATHWLGGHGDEACESGSRRLH